MIIRKQFTLLFMFGISMLFAGQATPTTNDQISVIFDMNGVLVETGSALRILGLQKFIAYAAKHHNNPFTLKKHIKEKLFELLSAVQERHPDEIDARDDNGKLLPQCMCDWMKGTKTPEQIKDAIDEELARRPQDLETSILRDLAHMMFTPEKFTQTQRLVPEAVEFATSLKQQGYKLYILSNLCGRSFEILQKEHPEVFELFDGIVISGDIGLLKPDPAIYNHLLAGHQIDARHACFIDDQIANVQAAQAVGISSFVCPSQKTYLGSGSPDIASVKKEFQAWRETLN